MAVDRGERLEARLRLDGDKVRRMREGAGYSQLALAEGAGVAEGTAIRAERGAEIQPRTARRIATLLGVRPSDLMREVGE